MRRHRAARAIAAGFTAMLLAAAPAIVAAEPKHVSCTTPTSDPRVTLGDLIDIELRDGMLQSMHWLTDRNVSDARSESHALECELSIDPTRFDVKRLARGSIAIDREDKTCRFEVIGTGTHLALIPHCRSGCQANARYRSLALNTETGLCKPLSGRTTEK
jgi:hypothetical protein